MIQGKKIEYFVEPTQQGRHGQGFKVCTIIVDGEQYDGANEFKKIGNYKVERVYRDFSRRMGIAMDILNNHKPIDSTLQYND